MRIACETEEQSIFNVDERICQGRCPSQIIHVEECHGDHASISNKLFGRSRLVDHSVQTPNANYAVWKEPIGLAISRHFFIIQRVRRLEVYG